ncbi:hypothetical protein [Spirulina major]|nr:hypothetical protein [Spirulina major]
MILSDDGGPHGILSRRGVDGELSGIVDRSGAIAPVQLRRDRPRPTVP